MYEDDITNINIIVFCKAALKQCVVESAIRIKPTF